MTWMDAVERIFDMGSPMVILAALLFLIWRGGRWLGIHFLAPIKVQIVEFLGELSRSLRRIQGTLDTIAADSDQFRCRYGDSASRNGR